MFCGLSYRLPTATAVRTLSSAFSTLQLDDAFLPRSISRSFTSHGEEPAAGARRVFRRPMRYGSKLAIRDQERFRRMQAILGCVDGSKGRKVDSVTISTLQTMKYLMPGDENLHLLQGMAAYKVTTLNRNLLPLLERTEVLLKGK